MLETIINETFLITLDVMMVFQVYCGEQFYPSCG